MFGSLFVASTAILAFLGLWIIAGNREARVHDWDWRANMRAQGMA